MVYDCLTLGEKDALFVVTESQTLAFNLQSGVKVLADCRVPLIGGNSIIANVFLILSLILQTEQKRARTRLQSAI